MNDDFTSPIDINDHVHDFRIRAVAIVIDVKRFEAIVTE
jgi:hypothetical protein